MLRAVSLIPQFLNTPGAAIFEMSPFQVPRIAKAFEKLGFTTKIIADLTGRQRFVAAMKS
jgi:methylase of polypeptide subunit release factors